jgi:myb proto-oncogene protein
VSPERSAASSSVTESSSMTEQEQEQGNTGSSPGFPKEESFTSSSDAEEFQFDDTFWSETLSMPLESFDVPMEPSDALGASSVGADGDLDYWLRVFMESGDVHQELPQI